jgi:MFS family permease
MTVVMVAFLVIGLALPVLPLHVHAGLGLSTMVVGLVAGSQFAASVVSRPWAGHYADRRGAKRAVISGLVAATLSGLLYLLSLGFLARPAWSVAILLAGRALLGGAESFIIVGAVGWGLGRVAHHHTGKVIAWVGTAMYAAFALGAPFGTALYGVFGFVAIAAATIVLPLASLLLVARLQPVAPTARRRPSMATMLKAVWLPGLGLAFSCMGFGAITAFVILLFDAHAWHPGWPAFTGFAVAFMAARVLLGHLPDKQGGARTALIFALIEAAGLALIGFAPGYAYAFVGSMLTGFGYSLVYPGLGLEAVRRSPPENRALAMGSYTAFLDVALGVGSPALGWIAGTKGIDGVFLEASG